MDKYKMIEKLEQKINNVDFDFFVKVIKKFGYTLDRIKGSHHIYINETLKDTLNIQCVKGKNQVKPYQVKQFLKKVK